MQWLETDFGLYALCPDSYMANWEGTEADVTAGEPVGKITLAGHGELLTLGGEPLNVAFLQRFMTFIRWVAAEDDQGLEEEVEAAMESEDWQDDFEITLGGRYVLLDSAMNGSDVSESDVIRIDIPEGRYRVQSLLITPAADAEFQLDRLVAIEA